MMSSRHGKAARSGASAPGRVRLDRTVARCRAGGAAVGLGLVLLATVGCPTRSELHVECQPEGKGLKCVVEHRAGSSPAKACWEVAFTCRNGTKSRASACEVVEPGARAIARMPMSDFPDAGKCDIITESGVENIQVTRPD